MTIQSYITVDWSQSPRIVNIATESEVTVQDLYDTLRDLASKPEALDDDEIVDAGGKEGGLVAVTMTLKNAQVKFENTGAPRTCKIIGGNIFAVDVNGSDIPPIAYNANVNAIVIQSAGAALVQEDDVTLIKERLGVPTSPTISDDLDEIETKIAALPKAGFKV